MTTSPVGRTDKPTVKKGVRNAVGAWGEQLAAQHLVQDDMVILDRNWRCESGELDLVARDGSTLVVCEVKTRRGDAFGTPAEAVTWRKAARLRRLALRWLDEHPMSPLDVRIDVIGIVAAPGSGPRVEHLRGVA